MKQRNVHGKIKREAQGHVIPISKKQLVDKEHLMFLENSQNFIQFIRTILVR